MKKVIITSLLTVFISVISFARSINTEKSVVNFKISNMKVNVVRGTFSRMTGEVDFNPNKISTSSFDVCIDATTVNTDNKKRDKHLRSEDYFDVKKYPTICFKSTTVVKTDKGYIVSGALTMHGVTQNVQIPFTLSQNTFKGSLIVKRLDYKIGNSGTFLMGNEAEIIIVAVLNL
ncbi:YceI family protein [Pseudopedobacter saltans DSM 12145]|uniref:YceI family protein n=1 Tax=Pseudopedobacter saltans (strain ATCC 51119 / DSM 12145 / JCM 21818 / CCUG 39354 / LMG 10337 / NBRC 100064 / NCIMB 13643) TaxID=762903 RepID=F0S6X5_PSESL|nr:YceI family protein [Pseudopedobacter saltans]ADY53238.1 YceI family protein [Pseudopedobacter saltans DSM 12145]